MTEGLRDLLLRVIDGHRFVPNQHRCSCGWLAQVAPYPVPKVSEYRQFTEHIVHAQATAIESKGVS